MSSTKHQSQLAMDSVLPFDGASEPYEFQSETLQKRANIIETAGLRGTRSRASEQTQNGTYEVAGSIVLNPAPAMLDNLLPRILGAAESSDVFNLAETLPEFQVMIDRVARVFTYQGCKVERATFRGAPGRPLELTLDIFGKTETVSNAGTFPALTVPSDRPYVMQDGLLTLLSQSRQFRDFEIVVDNRLTRRFVNSQAATDIFPGDRVVTVRFRTPFSSSEVDLYEQALSGAAATITFSNGPYSTLFSFGTLQFPDRSPTVDGRLEIPLVLEGTARKSGGTPELSVTHDSAP